jgi:hypothetical protein
MLVSIVRADEIDPPKEYLWAFVARHTRIKNRAGFDEIGSLAFTTTQSGAAKDHLVPGKPMPQTTVGGGAPEIAPLEEVGLGPRCRPVDVAFAGKLEHSAKEVCENRRPRMGSISVTFGACPSVCIPQVPFTALGVIAAS